MNTITAVATLAIAAVICFAVWGSYRTMRSERCCGSDRNCCCGEKKKCSIRKDLDE